MKSTMFLFCLLLVSTSINAGDDILLLWNFDDGTANDQSGMNCHGEIGNSTSMVVPSDESPFRGMSMDFMGDSAGYFFNDDIVNMLNGADAITISVWVKADEVGSNGGFIYGSDRWWIDMDLSLRYDAEGWVGGGTNVIKAGLTLAGESQLADEDTIQITVETISGIQSTEWQHIVMTWESGDSIITIYVNKEVVTDSLSAFTQSLVINDTLVKFPVNTHLTGIDMFMVGTGAKDRQASWLGLIDVVIVTNFKATPDFVDCLYSWSGNKPPFCFPNYKPELNSSTEAPNGLKVFPNPSSNGIYNVECDIPTEISVTDLTGKTVYISKLQRGSNTIDLSEYTGQLFINTKQTSISVLNQ